MFFFFFDDKSNKTDYNRVADAILSVIKKLTNHYMQLWCQMKYGKVLILKDVSQHHLVKPGNHWQLRLEK